MIDDVIEELAAAGAVDSEGEFTMDRAKAREKLRRFQLADPRAYVLELVQAAALKGATLVRFSIDARDMVMEHDGRPFTRADFDDVYGAALTRRLDPDVLARRQLALGLNSAMALRPTRIVVESGDGTTGARLRLHPDAEDALEVMEPARTGTRIHVRERFSLGTFSAFFKNLAGSLAEEQLLRARCGLASFAIDLEGTRLDRGLSLADEPVLDLVEVTTATTRVVCGLRPDGALNARVRLVKDGVWIVDHPLPGPRFPTSLVAVAQDHAVRKDVSQADIVRDEAYAALLRVLDEASRRAVAALAARAHAGAAPSWAELELLRQLHEVVRAGLVGEVDEPTGVVRALRRLRLWRTTDDRPLGLDEILAEAEARGSIGWTSRSTFEQLVPPDRGFVVYLPQPGVTPQRPLPESFALRRQILEQGLGARLVDVTRTLDALLGRERARRVWRSRPTAALLPDGAYLCRRSLTAPGIAAELGITAEPIDRATLALVVDGCLLVDLRLELPWLGLRVVVAAEPLRPDERFGHVERTPQAQAVLVEVATAIPALYGELSRVPQATAWRDACARSFLDSALRGDSLALLPERALAHAKVPPGSKPPAKPDDPRLRLRLGLEAGAGDEAPHPTVDMPLLRTLGSQRPSLREVVERARAGETIRAVETWRSGVEAEILVLDPQERALLQPLLARPIADGKADVQRMQRERAFLEKRAGPPSLDGAPPAVLVVIEGEGITGVLQVRPAAGQGPRSIEVLHRRRSLDSVQLWLAGECKGWVEPTDVAVTADFRYVKHDAALDRARAAVLRAFAAACLRIAERCRGGASDDDAAFLREVLGLPFPGPSMRAVYDHLRAAKDALAARRTELWQRLYSAVHVRKDIDLEDRLARVARSKTPAAEALAISASKRDPAWAVAAVDVLFPPGDDPHDLARRVLRPVAPLDELPLFRHHDGRPLTLAEIRELVERRQSLFHTDALVAVPLEGCTMALAPGAAELETLRRVVGRAGLQEGSAAIAAARRRQVLAAHTRVERVALAPGAALVSMPLDAAKLRRPCEGEVGLSAQHPGDPRQRPRMRLAAYIERAEIEVLELDGRAARLVAAVDDPGLQLSLEPRGVVRNERLTELVARCDACGPTLVSRLVAQWDRLDAAARKVGWYHVLDLLVSRPQVFLASWEAAVASDAALGAAAGLRGFVGAGGVALSALQLVRAHVEHGQLDVLPAPWSSWGPSPLPPDRPVVCVDAYELDALRRLLPRVASAEASWPRWQARARNREAAPAARALPEDRMLVGQEVATDGLQGRLAIPVAGEPLTIELCAEGKVITARTLDDVLPCWGSVSGPLVRPDEDWADAVLDDAALLALRSRSLKLYGKLARWLAAHEDHPEHDRVAGILAAQVVALRRAERAGPLPEPKVRLLDDLRSARVLALPNGRRISLRMAQKEQPGALSHLDLWDAPGHRLQQLYAEVDPVAAAAPATPPAAAIVIASPAAPTIAAVPPAVTLAPPAPAPASAPAPAPPPAPPLPTPEERMVDALRSELLLVRERSERLLSDAHLARLHVRPLTGDACSLVALADARGVIVNRDHPVVQRALREPHDPVWCSYVASAVYTALNVWLAEITDADERVFLGLLTELAAGR